MNHYHPILVVLHWLLACLIILTLSLSDIVTPSMHIGSGIIIGLLTVLRLLIKLLSNNPPPAEVGSKYLKKLAVISHQVIYGIVFTVVLSGIWLAIEADLMFSLNDGIATSNTSSELSTRLVHYLLTDVLIIVICLHILAALYHQFIRKDNLFSKMRFGKR